MGEQGALGIGEMGNDEVGNGYVGNGHVDPNHILNCTYFGVCELLAPDVRNSE